VDVVVVPNYNDSFVVAVVDDPKQLSEAVEHPVVAAYFEATYISAAAVDDAVADTLHNYAAVSYFFRNQQLSYSLFL